MKREREKAEKRERKENNIKIERKRNDIKKEKEEREGGFSSSIPLLPLRPMAHIH